MKELDGGCCWKQEDETSAKTTRYATTLVPSHIPVIPHHTDHHTWSNYLHVPRGAHVALKGPTYYHDIFPSKNLNAGICFFVTKFSHILSPKSNKRNSNILRIMQTTIYLLVPVMPLWRNEKIANVQSTEFMTVLKGNHHVVIWKFLEYTSGDYPVNQYFTNSDSTLWTTHNQVVPLGHRGHEWVNVCAVPQHDMSEIEECTRMQQEIYWEVSLTLFRQVRTEVDSVVSENLLKQCVVTIRFKWAINKWIGGMFRKDFSAKAEVSATMSLIYFNRDDTSSCIIKQYVHWQFFFLLILLGWGVAAADTILLQLVMSRTSYSVVPVAIMSHWQSIIKLDILQPTVSKQFY